MRRLVCWLCVGVLALSPRAQALDFDFQAPAKADDANAAAAIRDLAERILPVYHEDDQDRYLANLSALQLVAGHYAAAHATRQALHERQSSRERKARPDRHLAVLDLYADARAIEGDEHAPFAQAFERVFAQTVPKLANLDAYAITAWRGVPADALQQALDRMRGRERIDQGEALRLVWTYLAFDLSRNVTPQLETLGAVDDRRRYIVGEDIRIRTTAGVTLRARSVRPKNATGRLTTLLEFSSQPPANDATASAAHGYAGLVVDARENKIVIAGEGARAVREWLSRQSWSDRRIGLFSRGDDASVAWAAAGRRPRAFTALATEDAAVPATPRIPSDKQFAALKIPVLAMSSACGEDDAGTLHYFRQHTRYNARADHTLLLGACDTALEASGSDLRELRYQWFDHVFKGTPVPALLKGRVNYEDKATREWRHADALPE